MQQSRGVDLGFVTNLAIIKKPGSDDLLMMVGQSEQAGRWVKVITKGAAQALWFHLTQYLYPRAAAQITPRAATAVLRPSSSPTVTPFMEATNFEDKKIVRVRGLGSLEEWVIYFTHEEGFELWAALEKMLNAV